MLSKLPPSSARRAQLLRSQRIGRGRGAVVQGGTESMGKVNDACGVCLLSKTR